MMYDGCCDGGGSGAGYNWILGGQELEMTVTKDLLYSKFILLCKKYRILTVYILYIEVVLY